MFCHQRFPPESSKNVPPPAEPELSSFHFPTHFLENPIDAPIKYTNINLNLPNLVSIQSAWKNMNT